MRQHLERDELRYAIWLDPDQHALEELTPLMAALRQRISGPSFAAHLTLTSGISGVEEHICDRLLALVAQTPPFFLQPIDIEVSGDFFRAITLAVEISPALSIFRQQACQRFGLDAQRKFHPHLSLVYGEIDDIRLAEIQSELKQRNWPTLHIQYCSLWRLQGPVSKWRQISRFALTG